MRKLKIIQILPELNTGGAELGVLDFNKYLVAKGHQSYVISNGGRQVKNLIEEGGEHIHMQSIPASVYCQRGIDSKQSLCWQGMFLNLLYHQKGLHCKLGA